MAAPPISLAPPTPDFRASLAARLRGQHIVVPDVLLTIYNSTTQRLNNTAYLAQHLEPWLSTYVPTEAQRTKQRQVNTPLITSYMYSKLPLDRFLIIGSLYAWFFLWDDEIDCGSLTRDEDGRTDAYCDDSIAFVKACLQPERGLPFPAPGRLHNCGPFVGIGEAMQHGQSIEDRDRFLATIIRYIDAVRASQSQRHQGVGSVTELLERRVWSIGCIPALCTHAWGYGIAFPNWLWNHEALQEMMREVSIQVALYNDIVSLKKELKANEVDNIISILVYQHDVSAQEAVDMTVEMLGKSYQTFLEAVERLRSVVATEHEQVKRDVQIWVDACVDMIVGNIAWSLMIPRYLPRTALSAGSAGFEVVL